MKLKNKLLPLVGVAAVCATAAPIALTSCKTNNDWIDLMQKYNPTVKALDNQTLTTEKANEAYFGKEGSWKSDDEVIAQFKDDYLWSAYHYSNNYGSLSYDEAKVKFNYFKVAHPTFTIGDESFEVPTFTFETEYVGKMVMSSSSSYSVEVTYEVKNTMTNIPFMVYYSDMITDDDYLWNVIPNTDLMYNNESAKAPVAWSAKETMNMTYTISYPEKGYENTQTSSREFLCYTGWQGMYPLAVFFENILRAPISGASHYLFSVQNGDQR